jgi:hypothetical protein
MIALTSIRIGSKVTLRPSFGSGAPRTATITVIDTHKGQPVVDYDNSWAWLHQIDEVLEY